MDELIKEILLFLKENEDRYSSFFISPEESLYFATTAPPVKITVLKEVKKYVENAAPLPAPKKLEKEKIFIPVQQEPASQYRPLPLDGKEVISALVNKAAPHLKLNFQIPSDQEAKKMANLWKEHLNQVQVVIFSFKEKESSLQFLYNFTQAINVLLCPAKLIEGARFERENKWEVFLSSCSPKLIITSEFNAWKTTKLSSFYKFHPATHLHSLGKTPLLLLERIENYLEKPLLKRDLWNLVVSYLSS